MSSVSQETQAMNVHCSLPQGTDEQPFQALLLSKSILKALSPGRNEQ